jgi:aminoglycoside phosphotransferase (APT) family kinase protein
MAQKKMHADEVETDAALVRRLLETQFPQWTGLRIERFDHSGTDNAIYRLGDELAARLPRIHWAKDLIEKERTWLPRLAPELPLEIPELLAVGNPGEGYPWRWSVQRWLPGENATTAPIDDLVQAAADLAAFIRALWAIDATGGPAAGAANFYRGVPLAERDTEVRRAIEASSDVIDAEALAAAWEEALLAPAWDGPPVWVHGDLPYNMLASEGRLSAVIDFGCLGAGDPACDLDVAWSLFSGKSRAAFRDALGVDDAMWARGRGWALRAVGGIARYAASNPALATSCLHRIEEVLADHAAYG